MARTLVHKLIGRKSQGCSPGTAQGSGASVTTVEVHPCHSHTPESDLRFIAILNWCCQALDRRCLRDDAARAIAGLAERCAHEIPEEAA